MNMILEHLTKKGKIKKYIPVVFSIGLFILSLGRCIGPLENIIGPSCDQISERILPSEQFDTLTNQNAVKWITDKYHLEEKDIWIRDAKVGSVTQTFSWYAENISYGLLFENERFIGFVMDWFEPDITGRKVLACFGEPAFYSAYTKSNRDSEGMGLNLWYPDQGLLAHYSISGPGPHYINGDLSMNMIFIRPTTAEALIKDGYFPGTELFVEDGTILKPWSGSWGKIEPVDLSDCVPIATRSPDQFGDNTHKVEGGYLCK